MSKITWLEKILILEQLRKVRPPLKDAGNDNKVYGSTEKTPLFSLDYDDTNYYYYTEVKKGAK